TLRRSRRTILTGSALIALCTTGGVGLASAGAKGNLPDGNFPVRGKHQYWDGFGAGRGHTGQDIGAKCGTRIEVVQTGRAAVKASAGSGYGNYSGITVEGDNPATLYGRRKAKAKAREGHHVQAGDFLGKVGRAATPPDATCTSSTGR